VIGVIQIYDKNRIPSPGGFISYVEDKRPCFRWEEKQVGTWFEAEILEQLSFCLGKILLF